MRWSERRQKFRAVLEGDDCVFAGSVHDPISARIAEHLGFEVGIFAGSVASLTILGAPDLIAITLTEFADQALRINRAGGLPLLVDADHGYGNAINVMRTVEELEIAGVAALSIEDTELPQPYGAAKARLIPIEEGAGKMRAAVSARRDPDLVIAGRTSAASITSSDDAIARLTAYEEAGVDACFIVGAKSREQFEPIAAALSKPIILGNPGPDLLDRAYLGSHGVRVCLQGHQPIAAAVEAVYQTLSALRAGTAPKDLAGVADGARMGQFTAQTDYEGWGEAFLGLKK